VQGALVTEPAAVVPRHGLVEVAWSGAPGGVDRPVDAPFLVLERQTGRTWQRVDTDLGNRFVWEEADGDYTARYDVPADAAPGPHRLRIVSGSYTLTTRTFSVVPAAGLRLLGARVVGDALVVTAQNPRPDTRRSVAWRPVSPTGGTLRFVVGGRTVIGRYDPSLGGWRAPAGGVRDGGRLAVPAGGLVDGAGNRSGQAVTLVVGRVAAADWPENLGVGGGRAPGLFGEGSFPP
jgi:hypothetical protein